jgi:hypothetical protein
MRRKGKFNTVLDIILLLVMLAVFCIKGQYHESLAYTLGALVTLHIVWHWKQYRIMFKKNIVNRNVILDLVMFLVMLSIFLVEDSLHETLAYTVGILAITHVVLHWKQFKLMYCQLIPIIYYRYLVGVLTTILLVAVLTAPLYLTIGETGHGGPPPGQIYGEMRHR